jgi:putative phosphotransacetylase
MDYNKLTMIISEVIKRIEAEDAPYVTVGVSNRHIHLSAEDFETLFGQGAQLTLMKELVQPGEFAANETLTISGKKGKIERVRILGPLRVATQAEVSLSDRVKIGIDAPVSESGKLENAGMITLTNPVTGTSIERKAAIAAFRHIHMVPEYAAKYGLKDRQLVAVRFGGERAVVYEEVLLRVSDKFRNEMHLDTDEANAGGIVNGDKGKILLSYGKAI